MPDQYPIWAAGDDITAAKLMEMIPRVISKSADEGRDTTTTLANDSELLMTLEANATYFVEFFINAAAIDAAKIKTAWTVPSGATGSRNVIGPGSTANQASMDNVSMRAGTHNFTTSVTYGTRNSAVNGFYIQETAVVVTTSSGTCALQWAQAASDGTDTTIYARSLMRATRLA